MVVAVCLGYESLTPAAVGRLLSASSCNSCTMFGDTSHG